MFKWFSVDRQTADKLEVIVEACSPQHKPSEPKPVTMYKSRDGRHYDTPKKALEADQYCDLMNALSIFKEKDSYNRYGLHEYLSDTIVAHRLQNASKEEIRKIIRALLPYAED